MGRSRLPLVALVGAVGCTTQDAPAPDETSRAATSPLQKLKDTFLPSEEQGKGGGIRALTPEERRGLLPRPLPVPEDMVAQATAPALGVPDGGTVSDGGPAVDYAEQRRLQYEQHMQELQQEAARRDAERDAGPGRTPEQLARERVEAERFRKYGKGGGIKRSETLQLIRRDKDTHSSPPTPAPTKD